MGSSTALWKRIGTEMAGRLPDNTKPCWWCSELATGLQMVMALPCAHGHNRRLKKLGFVFLMLSFFSPVNNSRTKAVMHLAQAHHCPVVVWLWHSWNCLRVNVLLRIYNVASYVACMHSIQSSQVNYLEVNKFSRKTRRDINLSAVSPEIHMHPIYWYKRLRNKEG